MSTSLAEEAREMSVGLLRRAASGHGFVASPAFEHYSAIWVRDTAITSLGALVSGEDDLVEAAVRSMETIGSATTPLGQVAAVIRPESGTWDWGEGGVVDSTAWYVILAGAVLETTGDTGLLRDHWDGLVRALDWLAHQDVTGTGLVSAAPSTDWMDSSLVRSGRTLSLNLLYHWAARAAARIATALGEAPPADHLDIARRIDTLFWPTERDGPETLLTGPRTAGAFPHSATARAHATAAAADRAHYVSHVVHAHYDEHCDVLANLVAVCTGVADSARAGTILDHLRSEDAHLPHPTRVLLEPVDPTRPSSMYLPEVEAHLDPRWHNPAFGYHNGASWPYVGGIHVAALALADRDGEAAALLEGLAAANAEGGWGFHEWLDGRTGEPGGTRDQAWNAGSYLLADRSVDEPGAVLPLFSLPRDGA